MTATTSLSRVARIEDKIDRQAAGATEISLSGVNFQTMLEVMEFAKMMSVADVAVPKHLRGSPGACLAICVQALEWRMSPFAVANKSYLVNDRISYESQLVHAVIEQRAPIVGRLRHRYAGKGEERICIISAVVKGCDGPFEYESPPIGKITPKNSPLWKSKPDLQLYYNATRDWARMYFPDVILGIYAEDEIDTANPQAFSRSSTPRELGAPPAPEHGYGLLGDPDQSPAGSTAQPDASRPDNSNPPAGTAADPDFEGEIEGEGEGEGEGLTGADESLIAPDISTYDKFHAAIENLAMDRGVEAGVCGKCVGDWLMSIGKKGNKIKHLTKAELKSGWNQAVAASGPFAAMAGKGE